MENIRSWMRIEIILNGLMVVFSALIAAVELALGIWERVMPGHRFPMIIWLLSPSCCGLFAMPGAYFSCLASGF